MTMKNTPSPAMKYEKKELFNRNNPSVSQIQTSNTMYGYLPDCRSFKTNMYKLWKKV